MIDDICRNLETLSLGFMYRETERPREKFKLIGYKVKLNHRFRRRSIEPSIREQSCYTQLVQVLGKKFFKRSGREMIKSSHGAGGIITASEL